MASGGNTADHRIKIEISVQAQFFIDQLGCTLERCRLIAATAMEMAAGRGPARPWHCRANQGRRPRAAVAWPMSKAEATEKPDPPSIASAQRCALLAPAPITPAKPRDPHRCNREYVAQDPHAP